MKILIVSDTHGYLHPSILPLLSGCDLIVHCGDIGDQGVLQMLAQHAPVSAVRGNNDLDFAWPEDERAALEKIPWVSALELPGGRLGFCHGHQEASVPRRHQWLRANFTECRAVAYGHSHHMLVDEADDIWILNPGAAGKTRTQGGPSCLILHANEEHWQVEQFRFRL